MSLAELSYSQYTRTVQQQPTPSGTNFYDQTLYTTHAPYSNPYSNYFGDRGTYGSEITSNCDITVQQKLASCGQQLISLGVLGGTGNQMREMTLSSFKQQPSDFLFQVCNAYNRFNQCVGGNAIKQSCYALESLKLRYAVPDAALDFICGQGFNSMLSNWQCLIRTISRPEVNECDSRLSQNTVSSQLSLRALTEHPNAVCTTLRSYADCIRGPIESSCGNEVSNTALMVTCLHIES
uniref:Uncharacterized protein n=1 Tax=Parascaris equorum TaxID=6256 RepID=A0A914SEF9_PAREQ